MMFYITEILNLNIDDIKSKNIEDLVTITDNKLLFGIYLYNDRSEYTRNEVDKILKPKEKESKQKPKLDPGEIPHNQSSMLRFVDATFTEPEDAANKLAKKNADLLNKVIVELCSSEETMGKDVDELEDVVLATVYKNLNEEEKSTVVQTVDESDKQVIYEGDETPEITDLENLPSELQLLASELGAKYMNKNINPPVNQQGNKVIIGTKYDITIDQAKEEEKKYIHEDEGVGVAEKGRRRSSRIKPEPQPEPEETVLPTEPEKTDLPKRVIYDKNNGTSVFSSNSQFSTVPSEILLEVVNSHSEIRKGIESLITAKSSKSSEYYRDLLYETCRLRPTTAHYQYATSKEARDSASLLVSEKTQFADIWGPWVFNYASAQSNLNDEFIDGTKQALPVKCYICKQYLVPFSKKVTWGSKGERSCSEMEHTMPCITAYTQAPVYYLLKDYKHGTFNYLKLWKDFIGQNADHPYDVMKPLYIAINEKDVFDGDGINLSFSQLKENFRTYCLGTNSEALDDKIFDWVFEVIKYWLFEFSYAHHICNQVKSNRDIISELDVYLSDTEERWTGSNGKGTDAIDKAEAKSISKKRGKITLDTDMIKGNLEKRFDMMRTFSGKKGEGGSIRETYMKITNIPTDLFKNNKEDIMKVMVAKGLRIMYKCHKTGITKQEKKEARISAKGNKSKGKGKGKGKGGTRRKRRRGGTRKMRMKMKKSTLKKSNKRKTRRKQ